MLKDHKLRSTTPQYHARFVAMLLQIEAVARRAFRKCQNELQAELVADSYVAYARLVELDREHDAYPSVLANFSVRRVGSGIFVGSSWNKYDVGSRYNALRTGAQRQRLHWRDSDGHWDELGLEDRRHGCPTQTAALRVDFREWFAMLTPRNRRIAELLAIGERACDVANMFRVTVGRSSQLRRELTRSWRDFHGFEATDPDFAWLDGCVSADGQGPSAPPGATDVRSACGSLSSPPDEAFG